MQPDRYDLILAGGGLAAGLVALALRRHRPDVRVAMVEAGAYFGGNHIWSSFEADLPAAAQTLVAPLVACRWSGHEVRFPAFRRHIAAAYQSATSKQLHATLAAALPEDCRFTGTPVASLSPTEVRLADGRRLEARAVLDARGARDTGALHLAFQKFVGHEVELAAPHGLARPIIMDATVDQYDGYRFVYVLPFSPTTLLIEDTYYADGPALEPDRLAAAIHAYAHQQGWRIARTIRREQGVLPIALGGDIHRHLAAFPVAPVGLAAGLFHPVTGYSLPDAARLALHIASLPNLSAPALDHAIRAWAVARWEKRGFYRMLNRMLFHAAYPAERWRVLAHFYGLDAGCIGRFYAGETTMADRLRILAGKPPVPIGRAIRAMLMKERR